MIASTGIIGAEQFIRSIGITVGGYPNELEMFEMIKQGQYVELKGSYWLYFVLIALVATGGIWYQLRGKKQDEENNLGKEVDIMLAKK